MAHNPPIDLKQSMISAIEDEMHQVVKKVNITELDQFHAMMTYHLGWEGEGAGPEARGKRFRPLLLLLTCSAAGGNWKSALPAAASVELLHNFSLIHDDIQDNSPLRRGRATVWKKWGIPQAINTGDAMLTLAHLSMLHLEGAVSSEVLTACVRLLQETCLKLTQGQYLDMDFESRQQVSVEEYWRMVQGKTAALISTCAELGSLIAGANASTQKHYKDFGLNLGLAFQAQDDLLGIWGNAAVTGKSTESDLISGKKTLPVLYGVSRSGEFAKHWLKGKITSDEVLQLAAQLENEGGLSFTQQETARLTNLALESFHLADPQEPAKSMLVDITEKLIKRKG